jgi:amidase
MSRAFLTIAAIMFAASSAHAQAPPSVGGEHWVLILRAPGDSAVRVARLAWKADSIIGVVSADIPLVGIVSGRAVSAELRYPQAVTRLTGTRDAEGRMSGEWRGRGIRPNAGNAGTWSAFRTVISESGRESAEPWILTRIPSADRTVGGSEPLSFHVDLLWRGDSVVGFPLTSAPIVGDVRNGRINALWPDTDTRLLVLKGTRNTAGDTLTGTWESYAPPARNGTWVATRVGRRGPPRAFSYTPSAWFTTYSSTHAPGLRVAPGDTVRLRGSSSGSGIVPAPIYIDGAAMGDVLSVRILRIRPAATAYSQRSLILDWFTTDFARSARPPNGQVWNWRIDTVAAIARLDTSGARGPAIERLKDVTIPLQPMIGNIGVAPAGRQAFSAPDEGRYGGNLDYKWVREGMTLYLPVFHRGALLSIADDHHAAQGDGELSGTGLEVSADVDVVVNVIRGAGTEHIRAEDATHRYAFGVSADLSQALRQANTHLAEWLQTDFRLNQQELAFLLGAAAELDIANVWGSQTTVVAKIRKSFLTQIKP